MAQTVLLEASPAAGLGASVRRTLLGVFAFGLALDTSIGTWLGARGTHSLVSSLTLGMPLLLPAAWHLATGGRIRRAPPTLAAMAGFVAWCAVSVVWATQPDDSAMVTTLTRAQLLAVVWMGWQLVRSDGDLRGLLAGYVLGCVVVVALAWRNSLIGFADVWDRYTADGFDPNDMAIYLALGIPMAGYLGGAGRPGERARVLYLLYVPIALSGIALSGSRTGGIAAALALAALLPWLAVRSRKVLALALVVLVGGAVVALPRVPTVSLGRVFSVGTELREAEGPSLNARDRIWDAGLAVLPEHLYRGVGVGGFANAVQPVAGDRVLAHNTPLSIAVELGLVGLVLFFGAFGLALWRIRGAAADARMLAWSAVGTLLVGIQSLTWEHRKPLWLVLLLAMVAGELRPGPAAREGDAAPDDGA
jgi:O-antigen ligase